MGSNSSGTDDHGDGPGRIPRNRARLLIIGTFVLILVAFAVMILVGTTT